MKTANSRIVQSGQFDSISIKTSFAMIPVSELKPIAQRLREKIDWHGRNNDSIFYDCIMEVIHISEPKFETIFTPAV